MPKLAAGLLMYRRSDQGAEVLLVHPGGPFFKHKDEGVWSFPKGLADNGEVGEQLLEVAKREFEEEMGSSQSGILTMWAPFVAGWMARQSKSGLLQVTVTRP